jgi:hypothetical protein
MTERILDWVPRHDPRSRDFPISAVVNPTRRRDKIWANGPILDQGQEGACVGFGWAAEAFAAPVRVRLEQMRPGIAREPNQFARDIYSTAQKIDEWEGEAYEGTSVLAGAKVMGQIGLVKEYRWAFGIEQVADAVLAKGPVVIGIPWYESMYDTRSDGVVEVSGSVVGGHCLLVVGYRVASGRLDYQDGFLLQNSWGAGWGVNGVGLISKADLAWLLQQQGEACVPTRRSYGRIPGWAPQHVV